MGGCGTVESLTESFARKIMNTPEFEPGEIDFEKLLARAAYDGPILVWKANTTKVFTAGIEFHGVLPSMLADKVCLVPRNIGGNSWGFLEVHSNPERICMHEKSMDANGQPQYKYVNDVVQGTYCNGRYFNEMGDAAAYAAKVLMPKAEQLVSGLKPFLNFVLTETKKS